MSAPGLAARQAAATLLTGVLIDRAMLSEQIDDPKGPLSALEATEKARAQSIALGVLRHLDALDGVINQYVKKAPPLKVIQVLRIAAWEMLVDGVPSHAAVDAAVNAVKASRKVAFLSGLTNAVSRKISALADGRGLKAEPQALPKALRKTLVKDWGNTAVQKIEHILREEPPLDLTVKNPSEIESFAAELEDAVILPTGSVRVNRRVQVSKLPGFDEGRFWVQDAAAAMPVKLLGDIKGLKVLDLCAAPGGKTMQLIAGGADVTALDSSEGRMKRLGENLKRTGQKAEIVTANVLNWKAENPFDIIVLDAPCSATGTIRRHPDLPHVRQDVDLKPLLTLQARMIARAFGWLKPEGRLLYCTCSLLKAEGEAHVEKLVGKGFKTVSERPIGFEDQWFNETGALRLRPDYWSDLGGMDGFFASVLSKPI